MKTTEAVSSRLLPAGGQPIATLAEYRAQGGLEGLERARRMAPEEIIAEVKRAGLRGRGGAGFPTAIKWETVRSDPSPVKFVCCNAAEGEPGTFKDRFLIMKNPYLVLEGLAIAARAVGAERAYIGTKAKFRPQVARLEKAMDEFEEAGIYPKGFLTLALGPDDYLFGEEKALLEVVQGGDALPRILPPFIQGLFFTPLDANPTVVNNFETLSHVPLILARGAGWFRSAGTEDTPGTMLFTVCGDVKHAGVFELPLGTPLRTLLDDCAGGPANGLPYKAAFSGVANAVITPAMLDTPLDFGSMRAAGSGLGSGGYIVYDESACIVRVALMFADFLYRESCGQCVPCKIGNDFVAACLRRIEHGHGAETDLDAIHDRCRSITDQTRCYLPAETALLIPSTLRAFENEFRVHIRDRRCPFTRELALAKLETYDETTQTFTYSPPAADEN